MHVLVRPAHIQTSKSSFQGICLVLYYIWFCRCNIFLDEIPNRGKSFQGSLENVARQQGMNENFSRSCLSSCFVYAYSSYISADCALSLGISRGDVKDNQLTASSTLSDEWLPKYARLNGRKAWCGKPNDKSDKDEYLQIDLGKVWRCVH